MTGEILKSFLVGLGFGVDDASLAKFNKAIQSATLRVTALYATVNAAAAGIVAGIADISEGFEKMGYEYRIIAPAINKALVLRQELLKAYSTAGINITKVIKDSIKLNMSLAKTKFAFEAIYKSVGSRFFGLLTKQSDLFRAKIYANMPKILNVLERFVKFIFKAVEAATTLGVRLWSILTRIYDFFVKLDKATQGWSTVILAVVAAWELLNLSFLATPLGMIIGGLVAILALFDDFKTWQEGGKSLFDWSSMVPIINSVTDAVKSLWAVLNNVAEVIGNVILAFYQFAQGDFRGVLDSLRAAGESLVNIFKNLWGTIDGLANALHGSWDLVSAKAQSIFGGANVAANVQNNPAVRPLANPVGSAAQGNQTNQNVTQQTQISVSGSADANAIGKAVAGEQSRVNFDLVRNLKGATR